METRLFSSRLNVLKLFFEQPDRELYAMGVKKKTGMSYDMVHQYLKDLETEGILTSKLKGKSRFFKANLKNKLTLKLFETFEIRKKEEFFQKNADVKALLNRFVEDVLERMRDRLLIILLFGSVARGKHGEGSDVDILVVTPNLSNIEPMQRAIGKIASEYSSIYEMEIVPVTVTLRKFSEGLKTKRDFFQELWMDRIVLYGESRFFEEIAEAGVPVE